MPTFLETRGSISESRRTLTRLESLFSAIGFLFGIHACYAPSDTCIDKNHSAQCSQATRHHKTTAILRGSRAHHSVLVPVSQFAERSTKRYVPSDATSTRLARHSFVDEQQHAPATLYDPTIECPGSSGASSDRNHLRTCDDSCVIARQPCSSMPRDVFANSVLQTATAGYHVRPRPGVAVQVQPWVDWTADWHHLQPTPGCACRRTGPQK